MMEFLRRRLFTKSRARTQHREYLPPRHRRLLGEWLEERTLLSVSGSEFLGPSGIDALTETASQSPTGVDLVAACDTGVSDSDNITNLDNSDSANTLQFEVSGTIAGATVTLYADGTAIGSAAATGATTLVTTDGATDLPDGPRSITARQAESGGEESADSAALEVTVDTASPVQIEEFGQLAELLADDGTSNDFFGHSVSIDGNIAIVGATYDDDNGSASGSAYVFEDTGLGWTQVAKLVADDGAESDHFGKCVSICNGTVVVGSYYDDDNGTDSGSAYVFEDTGSGWVQVAKLTADDGTESDHFGESVSVSDGTVIVGAYGNDGIGSNSGAAYLFEDTGSGWTQVAKLTADDGRSSDSFGGSVSISGNTAIVGAIGDDDNGLTSGSAYIFTDTGSGWVQIAKLTAADGAADDRFACSVSLSGTRAIVGAYRDDDNGTDSGSAYVFEDTGSGWLQVAKLTAADGAASDYFGLSVSIDGDTAIVGAYNDDDNGEDSGSAYVFEDSGSGWTQIARLSDSDGGAGDHFGDSVSISGQRAFVGAPYDDDGGSNSGSAQVYLIGGSLGLQASSDTGASHRDSITSDNTPTFQVSDPPYFRLYRDGIQISGDYESGSYTETTLADGTYDYTVVTVDAAGNESSLSAALTVAIDTVAPVAPAAAPDLQAASDQGVSDSDNLTCDNTPTFDATGSPYFRLYRDGVQISGDYQADSYTVSSQLDGTYEYTATAVDAAGNESAPSAALSVTIFTVAPAAPLTPDLRADSDTGTSDTDNITSDTTLTFDVSASPYFRFYRAGTRISGEYENTSSYTLTVQADGVYSYTVRAVDAAGNESEGSVALIVTIDTTEPVLLEQIAKFLADDGAEEGHFGGFVSVDGNTAIVGVSLDDDGGTDSGAAYIFEYSGSEWTQVAKLNAADAAAGDRFGCSVSISGGTAIVGAYYDDDNGTSSGSAYIFADTGSGWTQVAKLTAGDAAHGDHFGRSVAISGSAVIVGAYGNDDSGYSSGSAYIFEDMGAGWIEVAKLTADDGERMDYFGYSVAISGETAVVGARNDDDGCGSAYVFEGTDSGWSQAGKLVADDAAAGDYFGSSVSISGDTAIAGAWGDDDNGEYSGSAYLFRASDSGWTQIAKLTPHDGVSSRYFGSVAIDGAIAVVGANGRGAGSAYVFEDTGSGWIEVVKLTAPDGAGGDSLGASVAISGDLILLGASYDDDNGSNSGSVYAVTITDQLSAQLTDDTGSSTTDRLTTDTTPELTFTFNEPVYALDAAVTVLDPNGDPVTPDSVSGWGTYKLTVTFSAPLTLDGEYTLTVNETTAITDAAGNAFNDGDAKSITFTLDTTAPTVALAVTSPTSDTSPTVTVTATDTLAGMAEGTEVHLDVDLNNDGDFLDDGETSYTTATLTGGTATFDISPVLAAGTYLLQARIADAAGNEGTSDTVELTVGVSLEGTNGADTIIVWLGTPGGTSHKVSINGTVTTYDPSATSAIYIDGLSGNDTITVYATDEDETVAIQPGTVGVVGETYELHATGVEKVIVDAGDGDDQAGLTGSSGSNRLYSYADHTILTDLPRTSYCRVDGFDAVTADLPAEGAGVAYFYDSPSDDALIGTPETVTLNWAVGTTDATTATAIGFQRVNAYANEGGADTATLTGSGTNQNRFYGAADYAVLSDTPRSFYLYTRGFETATAELPEGGSGYAYLYDSPGDDLLTATPDTVTLSRAAGTTAATSATATGFHRVYVHATEGGTDTATLTGSDTAQNRFYSYANRAVLTESQSSFYISARGFDDVSATSPAAATSYAYFYDSTGDDHFTADPASATMDRAESWSDATAAGFNRIYAYSILGGNDTAELTGNATGGNYYRGYSTHSTLNDRAGSFYHYVRGFRSVTATGSETDSSTDFAYLYDTADADTLYGRDNRCYLEDTAGTTYHNEILYFDYLYARSSDGEENDTVDADDSLVYDLILKGIW